jgi:IS30 family transposase
MSKKHKKLSALEREQISIWLAQNISKREIKELTPQLAADTA